MEIQAEMDTVGNKDLQDKKVIQDQMGYQVLKDLQDKKEQMVINVYSVQILLRTIYCLVPDSPLGCTQNRRDYFVT